MNGKTPDELWARWTGGDALSESELAELDALLHDESFKDDLDTDALLRTMHVADANPKDTGSHAARCAKNVLARITRDTSPESLPPEKRQAIASPPVVEKTRPPVVPPPVNRPANEDQISLVVTPPRTPPPVDRRSDRNRTLKWCAIAASLLLAIGALVRVAFREPNLVIQAANDEPNQGATVKPREVQVASAPDTLPPADPALSPATLPSKTLPGAVVTEPEHVAENSAAVPPPAELTLPPSPGNDLAVDRIAAGDPSPEMIAQQPTEVSPPAALPLARLTYDSAAEWVGNYVPQSELGADRIELTSGTATLRMASGAEVDFIGPTELQVLDRNRIRLTHGLLSARVPPEATGFAVETAAGNIVDLGTQFSVRHESDDPYVHVAVELGKVETVRPPRVRNGREITTLLTAGRTQWLPLDKKKPSLDWRMDVRFIDDDLKPSQIVINGQPFDLGTPLAFGNATRQVMQTLEKGDRQMQLVRSASPGSIAKFTGELTIDGVVHPVSTKRQFSAAQALLSKEIQSRTTASLLNNSFFDQMPQEMKQFFQTGEFPIPGGVQP